METFRKWTSMEHSVIHATFQPTRQRLARIALHDPVTGQRWFFEGSRRICISCGRGVPRWIVQALKMKEGNISIDKLKNLTNN